MDGTDFVRRVRSLIGVFEKEGKGGEEVMTSQQRGALQAIEDACNFVDSPAHRLEHGLHTWVVFFIMPIFALANAGVALGGDIVGALTSPVTLGIVVGLVVGKQIGITGMAWIAGKLGLADKPGDVSWSQIYGVSWLAGIGFTMSLFITPPGFRRPNLADRGEGRDSWSFDHRRHHRLSSPSETIQNSKVKVQKGEQSIAIISGPGIFFLNFEL